MNIKELLKSIPDITYVDPKSIITALLKHHYAEVTKLYDQVREFRKDDPLMALIKIEQDFAKLLDEYPGGKRLDNPVFDLKVGALSKKQKRYRALAKDYDVIEVSNAENTLRHYMEQLFVMAQNSQWPHPNEKDQLIGTKMIELIKKHKD